MAAVVDPKLDIDEYLTLARYLGVRIEHILETHNHADHVSGHGRLAAATGATIHVHRDADVDYDHEPFDDGWELELGRAAGACPAHPGHRPEHSAFLLIDGHRGDDAPWAVLSGDSLFVGDVARPDLAVEKEEGARGIYRSLHERLLSLPAEVELWPGHLGGSMCGGPDMDLKVSSTIGFERDHNATLRITDEDRFVEEALAGLGPQPPNFKNIVAANRGPLRRDDVEAHPLAARQVEQQRSAGALLVDVRTDLQFDEAHITGAVSNTMLQAGFGTKLAWIADPGQEVVFIGRDDEDGRHAADLSAAVGITSVAGFLSGGMTAWREEKREVQRTSRITVEELHEQRRNGDVQALDVREESEWRAGRVPGAVHIPYHDIHGLPQELDPGARSRSTAPPASARRSGEPAAALRRRARTTRGRGRPAEVAPPRLRGGVLAPAVERGS